MRAQACCTGRKLEQEEEAGYLCWHKPGAARGGNGPWP